MAADELVGQLDVGGRVGKQKPSDRFGARGRAWTGKAAAQVVDPRVLAVKLGRQA